jgi:WD40 repeat protein
VRQSAAAAHRGDRDVALVYATEARRDAPALGAAQAATLIDADYADLQATFRLAQAPIAWDVDWEQDELVVIDQAHRIERLTIDETGALASLAVGVPTRLTAIQHVPVKRELLIDEEGTVGAFNLLLTVIHPRASDLSVTLTAPSGAQAMLELPQPRVDQHDFILSARSNSALAALNGEQTLGRWELTLVDQRAGEDGVLTGWGLAFGSATPISEDIREGVPVPDPVRTTAVDAVLSSGGRIAVAQPSRADAGGALAIWDARSGERRGDLPMQVLPDFVVASAVTNRALTISGDDATVWSIDSGEPIARVPTDGNFPASPALSTDERFAVLGETRGDSATRISVLDLATGEVRERFDANVRVQDWVLGPEADLLGVRDDAGRAFVFGTATRAASTELRHHRDVVRLLPIAADGTLLTVDADGDMYAWRVEAQDSRPAVVANWLIGTTVDPASVSVSASADSVAYALADGLVVVQDLERKRLAQYFRAQNAAASLARIGPQGDRLVTAAGTLLRVWRARPAPAIPPMDGELSAVALDAAGDYAVFGFRAGHIRVRHVGELDGLPPQPDSVDYIGHRGAITSVAVNASRNIVASGGADSVVRIWNMRTVAPTAHFLRHPSGLIRALALSADGDRVLSAADYSARLWSTQTGELLTNVPVDGAALSVALARDVNVIAVGDEAGNIYFGTGEGTQPLVSIRAQTAVSALALTSGGDGLLSGDAGGHLQLWDTSAAAGVVRAAYQFTDPVTWVAFGTVDGTVLARSGAWVHQLQLRPEGLAVSASRLLPIRLGPGPTPALGADGRVRWLAGPAVGVPVYVDLDIGAPVEALTVDRLLADPPPEDSIAADPAVLDRDWPQILGLELDRSTGAVRVNR